jgi:hypothetical protein
MKKIKKKDVKFEIGQYIFTYRPDELISSTICELTCRDSKHPVSHIACVMDKCNVIESLGQRKMVVMNNVYKLLEEPNVKVYLAVPKIPQIISNYEYESWLLSKLGVKYDYWNLFTFQLAKIFFGRTFRKQSKNKADNKYICSELGSESMYRRYNILSDWNEIQYNPHELFNLNEYFEYYEVI